MFNISSQSSHTCLQVYTQSAWYFWMAPIVTLAAKVVINVSRSSHEVLSYFYPVLTTLNFLDTF